MRFQPAAVLVAFTVVAACAQQSAGTPPTVAMKILQAHVTHEEPAVYPPIARAAHVTGEVVVGVEIDEAGKLTQEVVISGPEMLRANAVNAVKKWTFTPVDVDGKPHAVRSAVIFNFKNYQDNMSR